MTTAKLSKAQGQITVRLESLIEDLHVAGAVHRFDRKLALFSL